MQTSCPACHTTFRVHQEQLGLRRGLVRCGNCNAVFNAYDTLLPELEGAPLAEVSPVQDGLPPVASPEVVAVASPGPELEATEPKGADEVVAEATPGLSILNRQALGAYADTSSLPLEPASPEPGEATESAPIPELSAKTESPAEEGHGGTAPATETPDAILLSELPNKQPARAALPAWKHALYLGLILLLTALLLGQLAYFLRAELAATMPASRPFLAEFCKPLGCAVPLPRQLTRQAIVSSSLEHDVEQKSRIRLTFLLANRTGQAQEWPHVVLTLIDLRESPVAQKALPPQDYLPKGISARAGFPAQSEQEVRLDLDIGNLSAASYLLDVAYPR
ncbi:MAG: DUF3426 domain-containing protein [Pseudomonadota bacterium]